MQNVFSETDHYFGIDVSKILFNNTFGNHGFILEPVYIMRPDRKGITTKAILGYSNTFNDKVYYNTKTYIQGIYFKAGAGYYSYTSVIPHLNLTTTIYNVRNSYFLEGEYFGDYHGSDIQKNKIAIALEPNLDFHIHRSSKISAILSLRFDFVLFNTYTSDFTNFYIPGLGVFMNDFITTGLNLSVMLK